MDGRLFSDIERFGSASALIEEDGTIVSHVRLAALADEMVAPLGETRRLVVVEGSGSVASIAAYVGCLRAGHVALLVGRGARERDARFFEQFRPYAHFSENDEGAAFAPVLDDNQTLHPDLALLLSSSGSTGNPKLIRLTHKNLISNGLAIIEYLKIDASERAMATLPMQYSYGMSVINSHLLAGATVILNDRSVAEPEFWRHFADKGATSFAGVPHSFELLARTRALETPPPSLRYFTVAGGKLAAPDVAKVAELARRQSLRFYVMYGQTEAAPRIAYVPPEIVLERPEIIGRAIPGGTLSLIDDDGGEILETGTAGELVYRGPNVMMGYARELADLAANPAVDALHTGDIAVRDKAGLFTIVGRKSRFIKPFGLRVDLDDVERLIANEAAEVAVTGDDAGLVVAAVGPRGDIAATAAARLKLPRGAIHFVVYPDGLPRLPSGKRDYGAMLRTRPVPARASAVDREDFSFSAAFGRIIGSKPLASDHSFADSGGDSLNFIAAAILLEEQLGYCPDRWEVMPVGQLDALVDAAGAASPKRRPGVTIDIFARCACILLIVFHHSSKLGIDGAAASLLALTGFIFGRFQPAKVQQIGFAAATFRTLRKILPVYMIVMLIYFALKRDWFWPNILFYANFTKGYDDGQTVIAVYWFIESYVHLVIAGSLLLALAPVQRFQARHGFAFGMLLIAAGVLAHWMVLPDHPVPVAERHSPFWIFYIFALGWAATFARLSWEKAILSVTMIVVVAIFPPHATQVGYYVIVPIYLLLLWANRIEFGSERLTALINRVAQSSLYIYLLHPFVFLPLLRIVGDRTIAGFPASVPLALFVTVPVTAWAGILLHRYLDKAIAWAGARWRDRRGGGRLLLPKVSQ